jgi:transposase
MPWKEICQMDQRTQFIARVLAGEDEMVALCREYGISRKTGYKWLGRYRCEGAAGLQDRSHAPLRHGQTHDVAVVQAVRELRERWRHWGPKKLRVKRGERHRELAVPAASTIGDWLRREGLAARSRRRRRCPAYTHQGRPVRRRLRQKNQSRGF